MHPDERGTNWSPTRPDRRHEVRYDGYCVIIHREGKRARLLSAGSISKLRNDVLPGDSVKLEPVYVSAGNEIIAKLSVVCR